MNDRNAMLRARIMRRVYTIRAMRWLIHAPIVKGAFVPALLWRSTAYVSYRDVLANAPSFSDLPRGLAFIVDTLRNTEMTTLLLLTAVLLVGVWALVDAIATRPMAHAHRHGHRTA